MNSPLTILAESVPTFVPNVTKVYALPATTASEQQLMTVSACFVETTVHNVSKITTLEICSVLSVWKVSTQQQIMAVRPVQSNARCARRMAARVAVWDTMFRGWLVKPALKGVSTAKLRIIVPHAMMATFIRTPSSHCKMHACLA